MGYIYVCIYMCRYIICINHNRLTWLLSKVNRAIRRRTDKSGAKLGMKAAPWLFVDLALVWVAVKEFTLSYDNMDIYILNNMVLELW